MGALKHVFANFVSDIFLPDDHFRHHGSLKYHITKIYILKKKQKTKNKTKHKPYCSDLILQKMRVKYYKTE